MKRLLPVLSSELAHMKGVAEKIPVARFVLELPNDNSPIITQNWLWPRVGQFFKPKDVIVAETGACSVCVLVVRKDCDDELAQERRALASWTCRSRASRSS